MGFVAKLRLGNNNHLVGSALYGTCSTSGSAAAKIVTLPSFTTLMTGVTIKVKFTNANTASSPTLNVNSTGAKSIKRHGTVAPGTSGALAWASNAVVSFTYDGTYWMMEEPFDFAQIWKSIYPVGSIYMSTSSTSPASLFGGTWVQIKDMFLLAAGDSYSAGATGGEASHTLLTTEIPGHYHTVGAHAHGLNSHVHSVGGHTHGLNSHVHSVGAHSHGLNSHTHSIAAHSHGLNSHTHSVKKHSHTIADHLHSIGAHSHGLNSHTHSIPALSGTTGDANAYHTHQINDPVSSNKMYWEDESNTSKPLGNKFVAWLKSNTRSHTVVGSSLSGGHTHAFSTTATTTGQATGSTANSSAFNSGSASLTVSELAAFNTGAATGNTAASAATTTGASTGSTANSTAFNTGAASGSTAENTAFNTGGASGNTANSSAFNSGSTGGGDPHNNMPPYLAVYVWKRTA